MNLVLDRLFVWLPVQCGIDVMRYYTAYGVAQTKYRIPKSRGGDTDGEKFSFYGIQGKRETVVFTDLREQFPSAGHMFRAGTLNVSAAQSFSRGVQVDYVVEIPLFNPAILERKGNFISRDQLPSKWVLDGASACLIAEDLKKGDDKTFLEDNKKFFLHRNSSPFQLRNGTNGLTEVFKPPNRYFHPNPETFWDNMPDKFDLHAGALRIGKVQPDVLDQARQRARRETSTPSPEIPAHIP